ncbi:MAG: MFS transporter [Chloroflexi bacterium]|nr:MAG: MFS transporter [Chloroflexota bacterium]
MRAPPLPAEPASESSAMWRFVAATTISWYGDWFTTVGVLVALYRLTGSPVAPTGYMMARVAPRAAGALWGGPLADRLPASRLVASCALLQSSLTASIVACNHAGVVWGIFAAVALSQALTGLATPAIRSIPPLIAGSHRLGTINALNSVAYGSAIFMAPALATPVVARFGPNPALLGDAATFLIAALLLMSLPRVGVRQPASSTADFGSHLAGLRTVGKDVVLRAVAALWFGGAFAATAASAVLVVAARQRFGGDTNVGLLYGAVGAGSLIGSVLVLRVQPTSVSRVILVAAGVAEVVALAGFTLANQLWQAYVPLAITGAAGVVYQAWSLTDMQRRVDGRILGRVSGVITVAGYAGMVAGALAAIIILPLSTWDRSIFVACCIAIFAIALGCLDRPLRRPRAPATPPLQVGSN